MKSEAITVVSESYTETAEILTRKTRQSVMPDHLSISEKSSGYNIYPYHHIGDGKIFKGFNSLSDWIIDQKIVVIEGYAGVFWENISRALDIEFKQKGITVKWHTTNQYLKPAEEIDSLVNPFLGNDSSVWGTKTTLQLNDFFLLTDIEKIRPDNAYDVNIFMGVGAALANWAAPVIYFDLPKNELQHRMTAGSITNLGKSIPEEPVKMYKRFYFVDWVVLNKHKEHIQKDLVVLADGQWTDTVNWGLSSDLFSGLEKLSRSVFRVRPWFAPGAWGGQWMKNHLTGLNQDEVNYAWSFELIVPENGLVFESDGNLLELSFDFLMFREYQSVLGRHAEQFKTEFPIRFDFLDTYEGGNLSIQCHPSLEYIQNEFGETITQDETYYILDCKDDANVYLGFQENIEPEEFRKELEESAASGKEVDIEKYVQVLPAKRHDLFLIPNGTVHSAGANNLVLEISATPYIFTFKMYDWVRSDVNGPPRPINIEHAFNNLRFERKGEAVSEELISKSYVLNKGTDWTLYHLPTHPNHFYDVHRMEFETEVIVETDNVCHVLMLVEGTRIEVETADGARVIFNYAETFVIPAAAVKYKLINKGAGIAKVVKAFVKY